MNPAFVSIMIYAERKKSQRTIYESGNQVL